MRTCGAWCMLFNESAVPDRATAKQLEGQSAAVLQAGWEDRTLREQRPGPALCSAHGSRDPHCCLCCNSCLAATATALRHKVPDAVVGRWLQWPMIKSNYCNLNNLHRIRQRCCAAQTFKCKSCRHGAADVPGKIDNQMLLQSLLPLSR